MDKHNNENRIYYIHNRSRPAEEIINTRFISDYHYNYAKPFDVRFSMHMYSHITPYKAYKLLNSFANAYITNGCRFWIDNRVMTPIPDPAYGEILDDIDLDNVLYSNLKDAKILSIVYRWQYNYYLILVSDGNTLDI